METSGSRNLWKQADVRLFSIVGAGVIIAGGLFSAVTARGASYHSAWLVAYLVLVVGSAQIVLGVGQAALAAQKPGRLLVTTEFVLFTLGNIGVIAGTFTAMPFVVDAGSLLLVIAFASFVWGVRGSRASSAAVWAYRVFVVVMIVSVIVGVVFAHTPTR